MEHIAEQLAAQVSAQLPSVLHRLLQDGFDPGDNPLQLECSLTAGATSQAVDNRMQIASVDIGRDLTPFSSVGTPQDTGSVINDGPAGSFPPAEAGKARSWSSRSTSRHTITSPGDVADGDDSRPSKRRKDLSSPRMAIAKFQVNGTVARKKRMPENPALQPSSLDKYIGSVWDSIFSGLRMDPTEVIAQWQAIEASGQPKLLTDTNQEVTTRRDTGAFGRINVLTRKISQTSRACRSLEVIVQAHWIQCFNDRVAELAETDTREKAKKAAIAEACADFNWTEKELRNKMGIWKGYHDIKNAAGWAALVFAGAGLYRFCKYRVSFTEETFQRLRHLRHRFEVSADTIHPNWRILLGIIEAPVEPKYGGHPLDWVVNGPGDEAIPLPQTYHQWDKNFSYTHLTDSKVDEDAWDDFDPRTVIPESDPMAFICQACEQRQSNDSTRNSCACYPNLYGSPKASMAPVQIFRTADGKNNGLIACCPFEKGWAVGEFVGLITAGLKDLDVMVQQTDRATFQIFQGKQGNHTRFVNHSCEPNSQYESFVWLGKQRTVLVSKGIEAGDEITVDYGHMYWRDLDKECRCSAPNCRYRNRSRGHFLTPPNEADG